VRGCAQRRAARAARARRCARAQHAKGLRRYCARSRARFLRRPLTQKCMPGPRSPTSRQGQRTQHRACCALRVRRNPGRAHGRRQRAVAHAGDCSGTHAHAPQGTATRATSRHSAWRTAPGRAAAAKLVLAVVEAPNADALGAGCAAAQRRQARARSAVVKVVDVCLHARGIRCTGAPHLRRACRAAELRCTTLLPRRCRRRACTRPAARARGGEARYNNLIKSGRCSYTVMDNADAEQGRRGKARAHRMKASTVQKHRRVPGRTS
jgi:hypothetical protein